MGGANFLVTLIFVALGYLFLYLVVKAAVRNGILEARGRRLQSDESLPQTVCPACGKSHDFDDVVCPRCGHDQNAPNP